MIDRLLAFDTAALDAIQGLRCPFLDAVMPFISGLGDGGAVWIGLTLVLVHIVCIPITGTSVNPARSIGPALFEGGAALSQLWLFIVAPFVGAALSAGVWKLISNGRTA